MNIKKLLLKNAFKIMGDIMDDRFIGKTYEELYERDLKEVEEFIEEINPFEFKYNHEWTYNGLWIGDAISEFVNPILNPKIYTDVAIQKIEEKQEKTFQSDEELFSTNIGDFRAKYCYVNNKNIIFYDEDKKQIASIETSLITDLMNENGYIIDK